MNSTDDARWPTVGDQLSLEPSMRVELVMPTWPGSSRFLARAGDDTYDVLVVENAAHITLVERRAAREMLGGDSVIPVHEQSLGRRVAMVTRVGSTPSIYDGLVDAVLEREGTDAIRLVRRWVAPLLLALEGHLNRGLFFGGLDPQDIAVDTSGSVRFRVPPTVHRLADGPVAPGVRPMVHGFAAPEVAGHCGGQLDPRTDVFFVGLVLYYLLGRIEPIGEAYDPVHRLPAPNVFHEDVPPGLSAVVRRAISPIMSRRYADVSVFRAALEAALSTHEQRATARHQPLQLDVGHELHIGVLKGQYAPVNQDDLFLAYHGESQIGLFVVSDGVSISEHGSGDLASSCVRTSALETWQSIANGAYDDVLTGDETLEPGDLFPKLPGTIEGQQGMLRLMLDNSNRRISERIHRDIPEFTAPAEGIMAATAVAVVLQRDQILCGWLGDSRIYLIRDGHIATLTTEHSLEMQLLRLGRSPSEARDAPAARALVRCVGEFRKNGTRLVPVPLQPEFCTLRILPGDTIVMCSDGIPDYGGIDEAAAEDNILKIIEAAPGAPWAAFELMVLPNRGGGGDNVSCIVLRFDRLGAGYGQ